MFEHAIERAKLADEISRGLGPDACDAWHVVHAVAHQGEQVTQPVRQDAELVPHLCRPQQLVLHGVEQMDPVGTELHQILVRGTDHHPQPGAHSLSRQGGDGVVGLNARKGEHGQPKCLDHLMGKANLGNQVRGHGRPVGLVRGKDFVAKGWPRRIVDHTQVGGLPLAFDTQQHLAQPVHRTGGNTLAIGKGRQGVKSAKQKVERVYDVERAIHGVQETTTHPAAIPLNLWVFGLL